MRFTSKIALALAMMSTVAFGATKAQAADKNWTPPAHKIYAQVLADQTMAAHPELLSVTLHGVPPGMTNVYTMFAGSYHDRIGNVDDPDDVDITTKGITTIDPRWHRTHDTVKKFVMMLPLRDVNGENIGEIVYAFHDDTPSASDERKFTEASMDLRDALQKQIPSYAALFAPAK